MDKCLVIPKYINRDYIMLWERDELIFMMMPFLFAFVPGGYFGWGMTLLSEIFVVNMLKQLGADKPNGYLIHWFKFNLPKQFVTATISRNEDLEVKESLFFKGDPFPPSHIRHIAG